ncbi:MAG TPA: DUF5686 family protein, partial [Rhodothermales bacterium]|nr:DUF5686 family protein [Rhodothermales bacterium]
HRDLRTATREADRLADTPTRDTRMTTEDGNRWLRPGRYGERNRSDRRDETLDERIEHETAERVDRKQQEMEDKAERKWKSRAERRAERDDKRHRDRDDDWWRRGYGWHGMGAFVGEYSSRWPYRSETGVYQHIPSIRYNRVEGFVLGIGRRPLEWEGYGRARIYGQLGYAFSLDDWRYEVGLETRLDRARNDDFGIKIGGAYHHNTASKDSWKTSWLENSLAAFFFENDFFDYHEIEGWTIYGVQRLTPYVQVSAGYRQDKYRSLAKETGWSLFDGDGFRLNPGITEGDMQSLVFAVEGGRVRNLHSLPSGAVFRVEAEIGNGIGGDFEFNRYVADGRGYLRLSRNSSLGVRLRGGYTEGDLIPIQKTFTIGGVGTTRSYAQNAFLGTRMLLGNAEYIVGDLSLFDGLFDDLQLIGLFDAGWVNTIRDELHWDDVLPSAGFGVGLDDRAVRLELSWPLRDFGGGNEPTLWLRISPNF